MHMKYGNSTCMTPKRKAPLDFDVWTPDRSKYENRASTKRARTSRKLNGKENTNPNQESSAKVHITSRAHYTYAQKAHFLAIFDTLVESYFWMSVTQLLERFHESNPAVSVNSMLGFLHDRDHIVSSQILSGKN